MIAVQGFGLKKEFEEDLVGTIRKVHEIGFDGIEPLILFQAEQGKMPKNVWAQDTQEIAFAAMKDLGMSIPSAHIGVGFGIFTMPVNRIIQGVLNAHEKYGIETFVMTAPFGSAMVARHWAKLAQTVADAVAPQGCRILYHNHDDEFHAVRGGGNALDLFLRKTSPDLLLQIDIGWAGMAGDEYEIVKRYGDKLHTLHLKDFYGQYRGNYTHTNMPDCGFARVGDQGSVRFAVHHRADHDERRRIKRQLRSCILFHVDTPFQTILTRCQNTLQHYSDTVSVYSYSPRILCSGSRAFVRPVPEIGSDPDRPGAPQKNPRIEGFGDFFPANAAEAEPAP